MIDYSSENLKALNLFYEALDKHISEIEEKNKPRINCRKGCFSCCKDDLEVFGIEAGNIRKTHADVIQYSRPHPTGACAFLDEKGACRIYSSRPFVCRTHGVPIGYLQEDDQGFFQLRDICPLNEEGEPLEQLAEEKVFDNTSWEEKLVLFQVYVDKGKAERVKLRDLFIHP